MSAVNVQHLALTLPYEAASLTSRSRDSDVTWQSRMPMPMLACKSLICFLNCRRFLHSAAGFKNWFPGAKKQ